MRLKGWRKLSHTNGNLKKLEVVILISDKMDFKMKAIKGDRDEHYIILKGLI